MCANICGVINYVISEGLYIYKLGGLKQGNHDEKLLAKLIHSIVNTVLIRKVTGQYVNNIALSLFKLAFVFKYFYFGAACTDQMQRFSSITEYLLGG